MRGGEQPCGGITWQDWNDEFRDDLPCPQLVGHTSSSDGARQQGRSWCIDGGQTCYACLSGERLELRAHGSAGEVMLGAVPTVEPKLSGAFTTLMSWADQRDQA